MVMIRLKQVLVIGVTMMKISEKNMLPKTCNRKEATNQGAMKIDDEDIKEIIEEVYRRNNDRGTWFYLEVGLVNF